MYRVTITLKSGRHSHAFVRRERVDMADPAAGYRHEILSSGGLLWFAQVRRGRLAGWMLAQWVAINMPPDRGVVTGPATLAPLPKPQPAPQPAP